MIINLLEKILKETLEELNYQLKSVKVIRSNRPDLCDYQCDDTFKLAKMYHKSPMMIGNEIVDYIKSSNNNQYFKNIEFVNPGFINITLSDSIINDLIIKMNSSDNFNIIKPEKQETFFIDYGGPNIAKPLHVGHLRPAIIGESIKRIIDFKGHKTISDVHYGDFGLQIGQVIYGIKQRNLNLEDVTLDDLNEIYPSMSKLCKEDENIKDICAKITKDLQDGDNTYYEMYKKIKELSANDIKRIYKYLSVDFDLWYGEMDSRKYIPMVEKILKEKDLLKVSDGALVVDVKDENDTKEIPPLIFKKSNGAYLYGSTDMATLYQREQDFHPDHILYVTDLRQSLHFTQVFRASHKANITDAKLEHLGFGTINGIDGKPYKTRSGETPKLDYLFEEVKEAFISKKEENQDMIDEDINKLVNSIIKYADLQNNRERDYIFDITKFSEVIGKTGPYILYTYLRINKILNSEDNSNELSNKIYNKQDRDLRLELINLELAIDASFESRNSCFIADYLYNLCVIVNAFYQNNHISNLEDVINKQDWLFVLSVTRNLIKKLLELLIIDVPTKM